MIILGRYNHEVHKGKQVWTRRAAVNREGPCRRWGHLEEWQNIVTHGLEGAREDKGAEPPFGRYL